MSLEPVPPSETPFTLLRHRLQNKWVWLSAVAVLAILWFAVQALFSIDYALMWQSMKQVDARILISGLLFYFLTIPLRTYRWRRLLHNAHIQLGFKPATEILLIAWFVNSIVPAKLGDIYRAWLVRVNGYGSAPTTLGTIFIERVADLACVVLLATVSIVWALPGGRGEEFIPLMITGIIIITLILTGAVVFHRNTWFLRLLPRKMHVLVDRFQTGSGASLNRKELSVLAVNSTLIWLLEAARLGCVMVALNLVLPLSAVLLIALVASLLTAVPLTPAGLGFVEAGVVGLLIFFGVAAPLAAAIVLWDRILSVFSIVVIGAPLYLRSSLMRPGRANTISS